MAITDITNAIIQEAEKQAQDIIAQAQAKSQEITKNWEVKINSKRNDLIVAAKKKASQKVMQTEFKLQSGIQTEILAQKIKILDKAYQSAAKKLGELSDDQYVDLMGRLINSLNYQEGELISVDGKESLLNKALKKTDKPFAVANTKIKGSGGFVFKSKDLEINNTFNSLIESTRQKTELTVSQKLFNAS